MIAAGRFAECLEPLGPFEPKPELAVAVSGGPDSLALALLADDWARARGGRVVALTVDHGLRKDSAAEARQVAAWLRRRKISHRVLRWEGEKPQKGVMAAARAARYRLLEDWCRQAGVLHLLLAHQQEDQAETLLMRLARGSGPDGLSAMSPQLCLRHVRLLRPLLGMARAELKRHLEALGQPWIEDPSNANPAFERARLRGHWSALSAVGLNPGAVAASASKLAALRAHMDGQTNAALGGFVSVDARGFAWIDPGFLEDAPDEVKGRLLSSLLHFLGGGGYRPAQESVSAMLAAMKKSGWRAATLAGCHIRKTTGGRVLAVREAQACQPPIRLKSGQEGLWDGRYRFRCGRARGLFLGALGSKQAAWLSANAPDLRQQAGAPPFAAWASLPAVCDATGVFAVPGLGYKRSCRNAEPLTELAFAPRQPLAGSGLLLSLRQG